MRRNRMLVGALTLAVAIAWLGACAKQERRRPLATRPVESGPETIESVRRQLQGTWTLAAFETLSGGQPTAHEATGELTYDEYGNLTVHGVLAGTSSDADKRLLQYSGRAVIDPANHRLLLQSLEGHGGEALPNAAAPEMARYYQFDKDLLRLTVRDANGQPTAVITWRKTM